MRQYNRLACDAHSMAARQRGWIGEFRNQQKSFFRSKGLCGVGANAYKMLAKRLYG